MSSCSTAPTPTYHLTPTYCPVQKARTRHVSHWPPARAKTQICLLKDGRPLCHYSFTYYCDTYSATFPWETDLGKHFNASAGCTAFPGSFLPRVTSFAPSITTADWNAINVAVGNLTASHEDRWKGIWHALFPKFPAPTSPYAETDFSSADLFLFRQHLISTTSQELCDLFERTRVSGKKVAPAAISRLLESFCHNWAQLPVIPGDVDMGVSAIIDLRNAPLATSNQPADSELSEFGEQIAENTTRPSANSDAMFLNVASEPTVKMFDSPSPGSDNEIGSRFSSALSATVRALTAAYERELQTVSPSGMTGAAIDPAKAPESSPPHNTPSDSAGSLASSGIRSLSTAITSQASSQEGNVRQKRGREEDDEPEKSPPPKRKRIEKGAKRLACPFQKRYPLKHFFCGGGRTGGARGFVHISHIKHHIHRCHIRPLMYCPNCKVELENSDDFVEHVTGQSCETQPFRDETALLRTDALAASLRARVDKTQSLSGQWFSVWRILFPGESEPTSCFVDEVPEHMLRYQEFVSRRGDEIIRDIIHAHGLLPDRRSAADEDPESAQRNEEGQVAFAQRVFGLATEAIFQSLVADIHQAHQATASSERPHQGIDTARNKGKAPENRRTASSIPGQTNDGTPVITPALPAAFTPSAVQTVPGGIFVDQGPSDVEVNNLTASNLMRSWRDRSLFDVIQPVATTVPVLHGSSLSNLEMDLNQAGDPGGGEGVAEGSGSFGGGDSNFAGNPLGEDFMQFLEVDGGNSFNS
ncbi:predicted protein [Chaetomium globosum CBS 148.51]|uniref:C2H2-type domain-containing protein n=1 Tax=Chaetomium globosum (strain ATCC 6205 / CBS 148.51 / DSM 1962 / NBRC 6347 / NRRL 1970) TaxID=306901 RepID=Q2GTY4_CHAGB|nr:uncharacterized protein CHGG_08570 [Chaetomium globosum CBS 148.51]EAQ84556.1 predicted protein [Chaetomium globosum CBS 148.51]